MLDILPPLAAYRADLDAARKPVIGADDAEWLRVAIGAQRAHAAHGESRAELLRDLDARVGGLLGAATRPSTDPIDDQPPTALARIRALVERMEDATAWHLATCTLHDGEALAESELERGRYWSHQARVARQQGDLESAQVLYQRVDREGRRAGLPELRARAWSGFMAMSQTRGNLPELEQWARKILRLVGADPSLAPLASHAHHALLVRAGARGDLGGAILHAWDAYQTGIGDPTREADRLINVAQSLLIAGAADAALAGFTAAIRLAPPLRLSLPAWGGLCVAAASLADRTLVDRASAKTLLLAASPAPSYAVAGALAEAAQARLSLGLPSEEWIGRARSLAQSMGYHEVTHLLDLAEQSAPERADAGAPATTFTLPDAAARIRDTVADFATREETHALV
jgi:tetratricopeptide (TPR) repeat protein